MKIQAMVTVTTEAENGDKDKRRVLMFVRHDPTSPFGVKKFIGRIIRGEDGWHVQLSKSAPRSKTTHSKRDAASLLVENSLMVDE